MQKKTSSIIFQIIIGLIFTLLNVVVFKLKGHFNFQLYLDTLFTASAAFFGLWAGLLTGFLTQLFLVIFFDNTPSAFLFVICNMSVAAVVHFVTRNSQKIKVLELVLASILAALIVAIEGGIIYTILYSTRNYEDLTQMKFLILAFLNQEVPLVMSSILSRIPVSLIDKTISVFVGFYFFKLVELIFCRKKKTVVSEK